MDRDEIIRRLRMNEGPLRRRGLRGLSLFGSVARQQAHAASDVDLAALLDPEAGLDLVGFANAERFISDLLGQTAHLVAEPVVTNPRLQAQIERDRVVAY